MSSSIGPGRMRLALKSVAPRHEYNSASSTPPSRGGGARLRLRIARHHHIIKLVSCRAVPRRRMHEPRQERPRCRAAAAAARQVQQRSSRRAAVSKRAGYSPRREAPAGAPSGGRGGSRPPRHAACRHPLPSTQRQSGVAPPRPDQSALLPARCASLCARGETGVRLGARAARAHGRGPVSGGWLPSGEAARCIGRAAVASAPWPQPPAHPLPHGAPPAPLGESAAAGGARAAAGVLKSAAPAPWRARGLAPPEGERRRRAAMVGEHADGSHSRAAISPRLLK